MPETEFLSPQKVSELLQVSCSTIKRWVDEGRLRAIKTMGGHRKILTSDVLKVARENGWHHINLNMVQTHSTSLDSIEEDCDIASTRLYEDIRAYDHEKLRETLLGAHKAGINSAEIGDKIVLPALKLLGEDLKGGKIDVCAAHHGTQGVLAALIEIRQRVMVSSKPAATAPLAMGCAPGGDHHLISPLLIELVFLENRWQVANFGPNTPIPCLIKTVRGRQPRIVWISVSCLSDPGELENDLRVLSETLSEWGGELLVGGQAIPSDLIDRLHLKWNGKNLACLSEHINEIFPVGQTPKPGRPPIGPV